MRSAAVRCPAGLAVGALAQPVPDPQREAPAPAPEIITPPRLIAEVPPVYPAGASGTARVVLQVDVDEQGLPGNLAVVGAPQPGFDEAALAAAAQLRFEPARRGERPVAVRIQYAFNFVPPAPSGRAASQPVPVNLSGRTRERGTRKKLSGIEVTAGGRSAFTDAEGRFELRGLPQGEPWEIVVAAPGYVRFATRETVPPGQQIEVEYRLQALFASP